MAVKKKAKAKPKRKVVKKKATEKKAAVGKAWTAAEIKKLKVGYKTKPASKLAKELKRTLASVRGKISALGLTKGPAKKKVKAKPKKKVAKKRVVKKKVAPKKKATKKKVAKKKAKPKKKKR